MIKNLLVSAYRSLFKKPGFTLTNVLGLAAGMAICLIIMLYVSYDLSFDRFQDENVYRIALNRVYPEREVNYAFIPHSVGPQLVEDFPEVEKQASLFLPFNATTFQYGDDFYAEDNVVMADATIFDLLSIRLIEGDPETALTDPNSIVLTETIAKKYFADEDPIGKILQVPGNTYTVTAIAEDYPAESHFFFEVLIPLRSVRFFQEQNWIGFSAITYIQLTDGSDPAALEAKIPAFIKHYAEGPIQQRNGISYDEYIAAGNGYNYFLQPVKDIYLHSNLEGELKPNGNINYVYIFSIAAIFILLIACINFMNLATARSTERAKEVGIRKVMGSLRNQLIGQFLAESILIALLSASVAFFISSMVLPSFSAIAQKPLSLLQLLDPLSIVITLGVVLTVGIMAGIYPAFFISSFKPIVILRGKLKTSGKGVMLRNVLVVFQFAISIALISATLLVYNQMQYMLNKSLGFEEEQVVVVENGFAVNADPANINWERFDTFKSTVNSLPDVQSVGYTSAMPGDVLPGFIVRVPGKGEKESMVTRQIGIDTDVLETLQMEMTEGRSFSRVYNDSLSIILNESAVTKLGMTDPVGQKILHVQDSVQTEYTVIGVVRDFHFQSLHVTMEPMVLTPVRTEGFVNKYVLRISPDRVRETLAGVEAAWNDFVTGSPFRYYFLDSNLESFYVSERTSGQMFTIFTALAIVIACIGLLGLSAFVINQKTKEIGVRKVMGASVPSIILLLSRDFLKLIGIASLIAVPAAYLWMDNWLKNFAYAISISWLFFAIAGAGALIIALLTISYQSARAALANPVDSLRDE